MTDIAATIAALDAQRLADARAARRRGDMVVGYIGLDVPEELILAAGLVPLRLEADVLAATPVAARFGDGGHPVLRSLVDRLIAGPYDFIDHLIVGTLPRFFTALTVLVHALRDREPRFARMAIGQFDLLHSASLSAVAFNRDSVRTLAQLLQSWSPRTADAARLPAAIALCNETRRLLHDYAQLRARGDHLSGATALRLHACATGAGRASFNVLLRDWLRGDALRTPGGLSRILYSGSATDTVAIYSAIEAQGLVIVDDDQDFGARAAGPLVDEQAEPLTALALAYAQRAPAAAGWSAEARRAWLQQRLELCHPDGVLFYNAAYDHPPAWEYPLLRATVDQAGLPATLVDPLGYRDVERIRATAAALAQTLVNPRQERAS